MTKQRIRRSTVRRFSAALAAIVLLAISRAAVADPVAHWEFGTEETSALVAHGGVHRDEPGPRPPEFPGFEPNNTAVRFDGSGAHYAFADLGKNSPFDFDNGDAITLDKTLVVIATEFGRPPEFDSGGDRGHQGQACSCVLAGGGLKHCGAYGETDELAHKPTSNPVSVPDFFATMHAALGIDYARSPNDGDRPVPITDQGKPIAALFG